jgi:hypothetical protein
MTRGILEIRGSFPTHTDTTKDVCLRVLFTPLTPRQHLEFKILEDMDLILLFFAIFAP